MTLSSSSCGAAAALLLLSTTASSFVIVHNNPTVCSPSRTAALHATTEDFQRSLLAAQLANNTPRTPSPTKSITTSKISQSVDYDAAARLAYESSGSKGDFAEFRTKYLQDTSNLVATKQRTRVAKEKAAVAKEKARKAAEAAQLAKEKAEAKIKEREEAAAAKEVVVEEGTTEPVEEDVSSPAAVEEKEESSSPETVVAATEDIKEETTTASSTSGTQYTVPRGLAIVPINENTVQFTAGALGAAAGLLLGGPFLAMFLSATANYLSRKDDEPRPGSAEDMASPKKIVDTAAQTALLIYNFMAQFERDNKIVDGTFKVIEGAVDKAKQSESGEAIAAVESTLGGVAKNIKKLNEDFDLVGGAGTVLNSVGDLVEGSVDKVIDLNDQYKLTERVGGVVKGAVNKVTEKK